MTEHSAPPHSVVLVAIDGSPAAATALPISCTIAAQMGARVEALHVVPAEMSVSEAQARLGTIGMELRLAQGDPAEEILRAGEGPSVALIVLTTHGHDIRDDGGLAGIPLHVAGKTSRPVLLVRPEAVCSHDAGRPIRRLLFPIDGTPSTTLAFAPATELAARLGAEMDVLFVVHPNQSIPVERGTMLPPYYVDHPSDEWSAWRARVANWIRCYCENLPRETVIHTYLAPASSRAEIGNTIADFAAERGEDDRVLARRSHMERGRAPILRAVFERTPCPVLLVAGPARAHDGSQPAAPSRLVAAGAGTRTQLQGGLWPRIPAAEVHSSQIAEIRGGEYQ